MNDRLADFIVAVIFFIPGAILLGTVYAYLDNFVLFTALITAVVFTLPLIQWFRGKSFE